MFFFTINAVPDKIKNAAVDADAKSASVNVWIDFPEQEGAEALARFYINKEGWQDKKSTHEAVWIDDMDTQDEFYEFYQEALEYGSALLFNTFSSDDSSD